MHPWTGFFVSITLLLRRFRWLRRCPRHLPQPTVSTRLADIEAYVNNTARATDAMRFP